MKVKKAISTLLTVILVCGLLSMSKFSNLYTNATDTIVENFENYGTNTAIPIDGISVAGGASVYLNTDEFAGNYSCRMVYNGTTSGEMYRSNLNVSIASFDLFRMYIKSSISTGTDLTITLTTADNEQWREVIWLNYTNYKRIEIQMMDFINTDGVTGYYDPTTDSTTITGYNIHIAGGARDIYLDGIQFSNFVQPPADIIDNFENKGTDTSRTPIQGFNKSGGVTSLTVDSSSNSGNYAAKMIFDSGLASWGEMSRSNINASVENYDTFNLCMKSSTTSGFDLMVIITMADSSQWKKLVWVSGTEWMLVQIPLTDFKDAATNTTPYNPETNSKTLTYYNISYTGSSKTIWLDDIKLTREASITNRNIDLFENRGTDIVNPLTGFVIGSAGTTFYLSDSPHNGSYSGKIVFNSALASWAEISRSNVNIDVASNEASFSMYAKSSNATGFDIMIVLKTDENVSFRKFVWVQSTSYVNFEIPITDFVRTDDTSVHYNPAVDSTMISSYDISFAGPSKSVWIDDLMFILDNTPAAWQQEEFILSSFHSLPEAENNSLSYEKVLINLKDAGLNLVELSLIGRKQMEMALKASEVADIKCMVQDLTSFSGMGGNAPIKTVTSATVKRDVVTLRQYKNLYGYNLWDEPDTTSNSTLASTKSLFVQHDPSKLSFSCFLPSYGSYTWSGTPPAYQTYVDNYITTVNPSVISFDYYPFGDDHTGNPSLITTDWWRDLGYIRLKSISTSKPSWFYFQGIGDLNGALGNMTVEKIRIQMYAGLAYGAKGLSYYNALNLLTDSSGTKLTMFDDLKSLNGEVKNLGNYLFDKIQEDIYHANLNSTYRSLYNLNDIASSTFISSAPDNIIIAQFRDASYRRYFLVVNKDYTSTVTGNIVLRYPFRLSSYNKSNDTVSLVSSSTSTIAISIPGGDAALYIIE
ncbi:MAG: hypothetical protein ACYCYM_01350 [Saccharofermentanales bacterium]